MISLYASDSQTLFPNPVSLCSALMMAQMGTFAFCSAAHILLYSACQAPLAGAVNLYDPPGVLPLCFRKGRAMLSFLPKLCSLQGDLPPLSPHNPPLTLGGIMLGMGEVVTMHFLNWLLSLISGGKVVGFPSIEHEVHLFLALDLCKNSRT